MSRITCKSPPIPESEWKTLNMTPEVEAENCKVGSAPGNTLVGLTPDRNENDVHMEWEKLNGEERLEEVGVQAGSESLHHASPPPGLPLSRRGKRTQRPKIKIKKGDTRI